MTKKRKLRQELTGQVVRSQTKTISVQVYRFHREKKYGKYIRKKVIFKAHDEKNISKLGDKVRIFETRPISKTKRWKLAEVLEGRS